MLSAQKEEKHLHLVASNPTVPQGGSFAKIVGSIQGLQQRLHHFSLDELTQADDCCKILSARISAIAEKLDKVVRIHRAMAEAEAALRQLTNEDLDFRFSGSEKEVQSGAPNKLIRFPRPTAADISRTDPIPEPDPPPAVEKPDEPAPEVRLPGSDETPSYSGFIVADTAERRSPGGAARDSMSQAEFDRRLLDEVIKDYGEFVAVSSVPPSVEDRPRALAPRSPEVLVETLSPASRHLPSLRREGEINRQLKEIIKDYGEYDLYSRQSSFSLKMGVLGAFLLMGAVFCGFYFFSSPPLAGPVSTSPPPAVERTAPKAAEPPAAPAREPQEGRPNQPGLPVEILPFK
ncbi:MAG TPA: hypothetical protein VNN77_03870 [candidate division Zixibacteria bacterium]|nr:hypothetical protein [candidate division Zixibacteria bacterium]